MAVDALIYYVTRIEHNTPLRERVNSFFAAIEAERAAAIAAATAADAKSAADAAQATAAEETESANDADEVSSPVHPTP